MKRIIFITLGLLLISFAFSLSNNFILKDMIINPNNYQRLPDDLSPYCCGEIINGRCDSKVDLITASEMINKGMSTAVKIEIHKEMLRCD